MNIKEEIDILNYLKAIVEDTLKPFYTRLWFKVALWLSLVVFFTLLFNMHGRDVELTSYLAVFIAFLLGMLLGVILVFKLSLHSWTIIKTYINIDLLEERLKIISK